MSQYTSYYLYQRYESIGNQPAVPSYPAIYSIDGDGTRQLVIRKENDEDCGYDGGTNVPQYRWVTDGTICIGYDKYSRQTKQVSYDSGVTWNNVYPTETQAGELIEANSTDCGAATIYKWEVMDSSTDYICDGTSKYYKEQKYVSYNNGRTWQSLDEYRKGELIEYNSTDCGYIPDPDVYRTQYFTIEFLEDGETNGFVIRHPETNQVNLWWTFGENTPISDWEHYNNSGYAYFTPRRGDKVKFKGTRGVTHFITNAKFIVYGNINSLFKKDNFINSTEPYDFHSLFNSCSGLTSAENLVLPATILPDSCYAGMFSQCTSLTAAPKLPATTLGNSCYANMFEYCTSLTTAPELPATTLAEGCYYYMFQGCESLTYVKCLATNISAYRCTHRWLYFHIPQNGTFVKNASMNNWTTGDSGIPEGWTIQNA